MIALVFAVAALGADMQVRPHTAHTLDAGEVVIRWPMGRSLVGVGEHTSAWVTPFDLNIGGPRVGVEQGGELGATRWSLAPSLGIKSSLKRASLRLESTASWELDSHVFSVQLGVDARLLAQRTLGESPGRELSFDRVQSHLMGIWDTPHARVKLRLPISDHGRVLSWATVAASWMHTSKRVHLGLGLGMLVGRPYDRYTLGEYRWWFWVPYPEVDVALRF